MTFDTTAARADLPSATSSAYFNAGTFGPLPRAADAAMRAHLDTSFAQGRIGTEGLKLWFGQMDRLRAAFARSLETSPDAVALMHATTDGCNTALWGSPFNPGDEVVTTTHEHPGLTAPLEEVARVRGIVVRTVEPTPEALLGAIGARTRMLAFSHVLWTNGDVLPVADIAREARARGVRVLVDGAQSVGAIPVAPDALGVDFYTVSGQKWLCGPSGTGALWISPTVTSSLGTPWPWYLSRSRGPQGVTEWTTARRLDTTTLSMTSMAGAIAALGWHQDQLRRGALDAAARRADQLRASLAQHAAVVEVRQPSTILSFKPARGTAEALVDRLERERILVRAIPGHDLVRVSVGFWNDDDDVARLTEAVAAAAR